MEMEVHHVQPFERLLEVCKDYGVFGYWGDHVIISRVVDFESPLVILSGCGLLQ